jgi:hypothetical protein
MLLPGTLCCETSPSPCRLAADCLCAACGLPLCARHGSPRIVYWNEPLHWQRLLPSWTNAEAIAWARLTSPLPSLPVAGFEPFEWTDFRSAAERDAGELETSTVEALRGATQRFGGSVREDGIVLDAVCTSCESSVRQTALAVVQPLADEFRRAHYERRLDAIEADLRQALRYVETLLGEPVPEEEADAVDDIPFGEVGVDSPAQDWGRLGRELRRRLQIAGTLARTLLAC